MFIYELLIMWQNDGVMTAGEVGIAGLMAVVIAVIWGYQFFLYRISLKKSEKILKI